MEYNKRTEKTVGNVTTVTEEWFIGTVKEINNLIYSMKYNTLMVDNEDLDEVKKRVIK